MPPNSQCTSKARWASDRRLARRDPGSALHRGWTSSREAEASRPFSLVLRTARRAAEHAFSISRDPPGVEAKVKCPSKPSTVKLRRWWHVPVTNREKLRAPSPLMARSTCLRSSRPFRLAILLPLGKRVRAAGWQGDRGRVSSERVSNAVLLLKDEQVGQYV